MCFCFSAGGGPPTPFGKLRASEDKGLAWAQGPDAPVNRGELSRVAPPRSLPGRVFNFRLCRRKDLPRYTAGFRRFTPQNPCAGGET